MSYRSRSHLLTRFLKQAYRNAFTEEHVKTVVPQQIRTMRVKRNWTQTDLAKLAKTTQTAIARVEDTNYGNLSLNTLLKIAAAFDVGLLVKFVPYSRLVREFEDMSDAALIAEEFAQDRSALERWSQEQEAQIKGTSERLGDLLGKLASSQQQNNVGVLQALRPTAGDSSSAVNAYRL